MEEIQGGHCPCSKIQGGQPTTLPPPCRAPVFRFSAFNPVVSAVLFRLSFLRPSTTWFSVMLLLHGAMNPLLLTQSLIVHVSRKSWSKQGDMLVSGTAEAGTGDERSNKVAHVFYSHRPNDNPVNTK